MNLFSVGVESHKEYSRKEAIFEVAFPPDKETAVCRIESKPVRCSYTYQTLREKFYTEDGLCRTSQQIRKQGIFIRSFFLVLTDERGIILNISGNAKAVSNRPVDCIGMQVKDLEVERPILGEKPQYVIQSTGISSARAGLHVWTDTKTGQQLEAIFDREVGTQVFLKSQNGTIIEVPRERLASSDLEFIGMNYPPKLSVKIEYDRYDDTYRLSGSVKKCEARIYELPLTAHFVTKHTAGQARYVHQTFPVQFSETFAIESVKLPIRHRINLDSRYINLYVTDQNGTILAAGNAGRPRSSLNAALVGKNISVIIQR